MSLGNAHGIDLACMRSGNLQGMEMTRNDKGRVAILYPGNEEIRRKATPDNNRFAQIFHALAEKGMHVEPAVYNDAFADDVRQQLIQVDAVLVWINPLEGEGGRSTLDAMLREVAAAGVFVSTHPDVILKMGTKDVLYQTRDMGWGCDTRLYRSPEQMRQVLPSLLASGEIRVLKQYRGNGGNGVWKIEASDSNTSGSAMPVRVRHAKRGSIDEDMSMGEFLARCQPYFSNGGHMIDQPYQARLPEGMVRCYLVHGQIAGFGLQAVNALFPVPAGARPEDAPQPSPRLYHPPTLPQFQALKNRLEREWVPDMQRLLDVDMESLPVLWDCDFLLGPRNDHGEDTYVLCEINVSSVAPFPESAVPAIADAMVARLAERSRPMPGHSTCHGAHL